MRLSVFLNKPVKFINGFHLVCLAYCDKINSPFSSLKMTSFQNMHGRAPSSFYSESAKNIAPRQNSIKWFLPSFCWKKRIQLPYKWQMVVLNKRKIYNRYQILLCQVICKTYSEVTRVCSLYVTNTKLNKGGKFLKKLCCCVRVGYNTIMWFYEEIMGFS